MSHNEPTPDSADMMGADAPAPRSRLAPEALLAGLLDGLVFLLSGGVLSKEMHLSESERNYLLAALDPFSEFGMRDF